MMCNNVKRDLRTKEQHMVNMIFKNHVGEEVYNENGQVNEKRGGTENGQETNANNRNRGLCNNSD